MANTIQIDTLINEISMNFIEPPLRNTIIASINSVIHRINSLIGKENKMIDISGNGTNWEDITTNWEDLTTNWEDLGVMVDGFTYDTAENKLTIPITIDKVFDFWVDDEIYYQKTYQEVKNGSILDKSYCQIGSDVYFSGDITDGNPVLKAQVSQNYADIKDDYVTLSYDYQSLLVSGGITMLTSMQKYMDNGLYAIHSRIFEEQLDKMLAQKNSIDSPDFINYGAVDDLTTNIGDSSDYYLSY